MDLLLWALMLAAVMAYAGWPLMRAAVQPADWAPMPASTVTRAQMIREERRLAALNVVRDLDVDYEVGRLDEEEYKAERAQAVREAARYLDAAPADAEPAREPEAAPAPPETESKETAE